ncbi:14-3-3-like protein [Tritrichomonas foetus]|uniref:14-3-3-like protein n=1 Tax=Tritrichomonas foetus TaxID=1144522 RepID=A0A1J4JIP2_9EUKA|nr:14-3-3-like protein [Tritrichomonas foetus]|eukprot:OHS99006.1 14-3-3-like protein [Tritrichomonas foetus]
MKTNSNSNNSNKFLNQMDEKQSDLCFLARLYYEISHFQEAMDCVERLSQINPVFNYDDLMLLNVITKARVDPERSTIRTLASYSDSEEKENHVEIVDRIRNYQDVVKHDLQEFAYRSISLIENVLKPNSDSSENIAFCDKILGDLYRYIVECGDESERENARNNAEKCYREALDIAKADLIICSPVRLNIILNYAVFVYEHDKKPDDAIEILKKLIETDLPGLQQIDGEKRAESERIINVIQNNLGVWCAQRSYQA